MFLPRHPLRGPAFVCHENGILATRFRRQVHLPPNEQICTLRDLYFIPLDINSIATWLLRGRCLCTSYCAKCISYSIPLNHHNRPMKQES